MNVSDLIEQCLAFVESQPVIALIILGVVLVLLYFQTKFVLKTIGAVVIVFLVLYALSLFSNTTSSGLEQKHKMYESGSE